MGQLVSDVTEILDYKDAKKQAKSQRQEILAQMASDDAEKTNLVKKVLATQRAKYGASGMSNNGVTEGAVLKWQCAFRALKKGSVRLVYHKISKKSRYYTNI